MHLIRFLARGSHLALPHTPAIEFSLDIGLFQSKTGRAAIHHDPDGLPVRLPPSRNAETDAKATPRHISLQRVPQFQTLPRKRRARHWKLSHPPILRNGINVSSEALQNLPVDFPVKETEAVPVAQCAGKAPRN